MLSKVQWEGRKGAVSLTLVTKSPDVCYKIAKNGTATARHGDYHEASNADYPDKTPSIKSSKENSVPSAVRLTFGYGPESGDQWVDYPVERANS